MLALLLTAASAAPVQAPAPEPPDLALVGASVLDPSGESWRSGQAVLLHGGRIASIGPESALPAETSRLYLDGLYLVPGLIDLHTHLLLHPYDEAPWDDQVLREALELRTLRAAAAARATLEAGFTTVRELGTEGAGFADVALRDAVASGMIAGPRICASTRAIVASSSYGPAGFDPRWDPPQGAQEVTGADAMRRAVREQIAAGADWIKVYADYHRRPGAPSTATLSAEELRAAVDEARSAGLPVAAHANTAEGIARALAAGVRTIEHGTGAGDAELQRMAEQGVALCPTLAAAEAVARYAGWQGGEPRPEALRQALDLVGRAQRAGVRLACGSDAGVFAHGRNARELELLHAAGLSNAQALAAATRTAAEVLGRPDLGRIAPGAAADLVALAADPLQDLQTLERPLLVVQAGRVACDRRAAGAGAQGEVLAACHAFLDSYSRQDFAAVRAWFLPGATVAVPKPDGASAELVPAAEFLERAQTALARIPDFREWLCGAPQVQLDGPIATVSAPFCLTAGGQLHHGVDVFHLVRTPAGWKFQGLGYSSAP